MARLPASLTLPGLPPRLARELRAEPAYALETLALAAVEVHGPAAARWAAEQQLRGRGSTKAAKAAKRRFRRIARVEGAALGLGGVITIAPDVLALIWILTRETLHVAAAFGHDPQDRARAAEMLVVLEVYDTVEAAQAGLERRGERLAVALAKTQVGRQLGSGGRGSLSGRLTRFAGKRLARRFGGRLVPGLGAVLGSLDNAAAASRYGDRAIAFYGRPR